MSQIIALDTSAILAILLREPEEEPFARLIAANTMIVGAPTLVEARLALEGSFADRATDGLRAFQRGHWIEVVPFDSSLFEAAIAAFSLFGRGRGHPAKLNFGDCLSYAVAKAHDAPLLFKGDDFTHTDLVPAYVPTP